MSAAHPWAHRAKLIVTVLPAALAWIDRNCIYGKLPDATAVLAHTNSATTSLQEAVLLLGVDEPDGAEIDAALSKALLHLSTIPTTFGSHLENRERVAQRWEQWLNLHASLGEHAATIAESSVMHFHEHEGVWEEHQGAQAGCPECQ